VVNAPQHQLVTPVILGSPAHSNVNNINPERLAEDKKKEAISFLKFYFRVNPNLRTTTLRRTTLLALYTAKVPIDSRYKKPNDMANLCGVTYGHIHASLDDNTIRDYIKIVDLERQSVKKEGKKRRRKKQATVAEGANEVPIPAPQPPEMNQHDLFVACLKFSPHISFLELIPPDQLDPSAEWVHAHPDYDYTIDDITRWETELKEQKVHSKLLEDVGTTTSPFAHLQRPQDRRVDIPVNIFETADAFVIYAFIPYHKPNAMKITVNQMEIILEGVISLPSSAMLSTGEEVSFPEGLVCTRQEIPEGNFYKQVKLPTPVTNSVVGKRDGVIVIHARKDESQSTVHQL